MNFIDVRADFPILAREIYGHRLVYLDSAASTLKPQSVIDTLAKYYLLEASNVHRGAHFLSDLGTQAYEGAREKVRAYIGARDAAEVIFTRGTTESINLVAASYGRKHLRAGDEIILSEMEHHSNIVPWQMLCEERGCVLRVIPVLESGELDMLAYRQMLSKRTKFVSVVWCSNALGTINPIEEIIAQAHDVGARVCIDAAQAASSQLIDVQKLDCDFLAFSGHKMFAPNGIGVLYGKAEWLANMPPYQGGGSMIEQVTFEKTTYNEPPHRFEAGTPSIGDAIALGSAIDYINKIKLERIHAHEQALLGYATERVAAVPGVRMVGTASRKVSILSFIANYAHPADIGSLLDRSGVAVRAGHHCCQPLMKRFAIPGTVRAAFSIYNQKEDVDVLVEALRRSREFF
jgi:cysteine desulfurase/selenocysteine lyase